MQKLGFLQSNGVKRLAAMVLAAGLSLAALQSASAQTPAHARDWNQTGGPVLKGYAILVKDGILTVRQTTDGKDVTVPLNKLSDLDQAYVQENLVDGVKPAKSPAAWIDGYRLRFVVRAANDPALIKSESILVTLPVGSWLNPDGTDLVAQTRSGQVIPVYTISHDPKGNTLVQFKRNGDDNFYWIYASSKSGAPGPKAEPIAEGLTVEVRKWAGENLSSWKDVAEGLGKSDNVIGNTIVPEIIQNANPARPGDSRNFATSYRGHMKIPKTGFYQIYLNCDDAAFLFVDGKLLVQSPGAKTRTPATHFKFPKEATPATFNYPFGSRVELTEGLHKFELHHVLGNNPAATGYCVPIWIPSDKSTFTFLPRTLFSQALVANVVAMETPAGQGATFEYGIDDSLSCNGVKIWLIDFRAQGAIKDPSQLVWDFGDGTTGTGLNPSHVYLSEGEFNVTLKSGDLPIMKRTVYVWTPPISTSPLSLGKAVKVIDQMEWKKLKPAQIKTIFEYLMICEQATRWPLMEKVTTHLLATPNEDPKLRALLYSQLIQSMAYQLRAKDATKLEEKVLSEFAKLPSLALTVKMAFADLYADHLKDYTEASKRYEKMIEEYRRLDHPAVRQAAIKWGDLFVKTGELTRAADAYTLATKLGGQEFKSSPNEDAITRGSLLRVAEQRLKSGDIRQTRTLLERIEINYPDQKLDGLYNYLVAETDRSAGRYESALNNYEIVLKLQNWAGFHDRALYGIADTYRRMYKFEEAMKVLDMIETSYPAFFKTNKLEAVRESIKTKLSRIQREAAAQQRGAAGAAAPAPGAPGAKPDVATLVFQGIANCFQPPDAQGRPFGIASGFKLVQGMGLHGDLIALCQALPVNYSRSFAYTVRLRNIESEGDFVAELWYKTEDLDATTYAQQVNIALRGGGGVVNPVGGSLQPVLERSYGTWRKVTVNLRSPVTQDGELSFVYYYAVGALQLDGFRIMPVSPREMDAYRNFIQGNTEE
jgi:tetratricopeptide (TPR) repeat protein